MTERLREKAREFCLHWGLDQHDDEGVVYAALLSARDEALEEAARECEARASVAFGDESMAFTIAAYRISSLKSKVAP